jgi:hypothetical protein
MSFSIKEGGKYDHRSVRCYRCLIYNLAIELVTLLFHNLKHQSSCLCPKERIL